MKAKLSDIAVSAPSGSLAVPVRFSTPEPEVGDMTYPVIVIERGTISPAPDRMHQGWGLVPFVEGKPEPSAGDLWNYYGDWPIPHDVHYQISVLCRTQTHQTELIGILARGDRLPAKYGYLEIPQTQRCLPLNLVSGPESPTPITDTNGKRLFTTHYLVQVQTEFMPWEAQRYELIQHVRGEIVDAQTKKWTLATFDDQT
ncbi:hypothetical protein [Microbispora sp. NPDC049633]|uniref:hypothetical protein n=1 Tax=Microbispora sp. NPDC049633 TaxID=3154355 RepID=UPI00342B0F65